MHTCPDTLVCQRLNNKFPVFNADLEKMTARFDIRALFNNLNAVGGDLRHADELADVRVRDFQRSSQIDALDAGADDYVTKPFGVFELMARIRVALRHLDLREKDEEASVLSTGDLKVDFSRREVFISDKAVHLTPTEYKLLTLLARSPG